MSKDPNQLLDLMSVPTEMQGAIIAGRLRSEGIDAFVFATAGSMMQWELPTIAPVKVQVRRGQLEAARTLLEAWQSERRTDDAEAASSADRPEELDGHGRLLAALHCRSCGYSLLGLAPPFRCPECGDLEPMADMTPSCVRCGTDLSDEDDQTLCPVCESDAVALQVGHSSSEFPASAVARGRLADSNERPREGNGWVTAAWIVVLGLIITLVIVW